MNIRDLLKKHCEINDAINAKLELIEELKSLATTVTSSVFAGGGGQGVSDRVGRTTARIVDLENEINEDIDHLVEIKAEILGIVSALKDEREKAIIQRRYIQGQSWEKVAESLGYSPRHIKRIHNRIIENLEKLYGEAAG